MRFATAIVGSLCWCMVTPALAELGAPSDENEVLPSPPNPASDACASVAAFMIAPQVFVPGDEKDLPGWIQACNAHPDPSMCRDTIKIIMENQREVPPGLKCD